MVDTMTYSVDRVENIVFTQNTVAGNTETLVGSIYITPRNINVIRAFLGETSAESATASLKMTKNSDASTVVTLTSSSAAASVTATDTAITAVGWYDFYLYTNHASGIAFCSGIRME
jgi:hypothetical protein